MLSNKKFNPMVTELYIMGSVSLVFITQSYFDVPENIRLTLAQHYFVMKTTNKIEIQQITCIHSLDSDFQTF